METRRILMVEDEIKIARFVELELQHEGYEVDVAANGPDGLQKALEKSYDLIILDIMLPGMNGIDVLRRLRQNSQVPVIMLTAKGETMNKVLGLEMGADDYITKPFEIEELLARIRAALRRQLQTAVNAASVLRVSRLKIDPGQHAAFWDQLPIDLTKREFDLLRYLAENKNVVLSRQQLIETVWGYDYAGETNVVDVYIRYLRAKIDDQYGTKLIHTIRGVGYVMKDE